MQPTSCSSSASPANTTRPPLPRSYGGTGRWCSASVSASCITSTTPKTPSRPRFSCSPARPGSQARPELLANWLYGVACRTALNARAETARRRACERPVVDTRVEATAEVAWHDLRPVLDEEVNRLPDVYRVPFVLCYLEGMTNNEASRHLGCPKGTVLSRLARARERLRVRLA